MGEKNIPSRSQNKPETHLRLKPHSSSSVVVVVGGILGACCGTLREVVVESRWQLSQDSGTKQTKIL